VDCDNNGEITMKEQRYQIMKTLHRIEELVDKLPEVIAAAVVECISEAEADDEEKRGD